ncbi:MAG: TolC family protein [Campylobacterales bacterium]|nr:TolC family protein [Campylobacterales bacterium]
MRLTRYNALLLLLVPHLFGASLSLDKAVEQFVEHNYDLQIVRHEAQKSRADLITAKEHPNPILNGSYEFMDIQHHFSDQARGSNAQVTLMLAHPFETGGKRDRRVELANHAITYNDFIVDETVREQLTTLVNAYYAVLNDQENVFNAQENGKMYTSVMAIAKTKLDNGFLSQIDYQKLLLQKIDYTREIENNRLSLVQDREALAALLALSTSDITVTAPMNSSNELQSLDSFLAKAVERADCKAAKQNVAVADASLKLEKAIAIPNITVGAEYASFGPYYEPLLGLNFAMPLPVYDKNEGDIERARITTLQSVNLYDKTLRMAKADVLQSYEAAQSRHTIYRMMREGFKSAKELKEKQEKIFALKGISTLELLDAQKNYRDYQKNLTQAMIDFYSATARLKLSSGLSLLESKGL